MAEAEQSVRRIIKQYAYELKGLGIIPARIILFGSYATGHPHKESDIDLIVVSENFKDKNLRERLEILGLAAGKVFEPIEAIGYTEGEIVSHEKGSFLNEIIEKGLTVSF